MNLISEKTFFLLPQTGCQNDWDCPAQKPKCLPTGKCGGVYTWIGKTTESFLTYAKHSRCVKWTAIHLHKFGRLSGTGGEGAFALITSQSYVVVMQKQIIFRKNSNVSAVILRSSVCIMQNINLITELSLSF